MHAAHNVPRGIAALGAASRACAAGSWWRRSCWPCPTSRRRRARARDVFPWLMRQVLPGAARPRAVDRDRGRELPVRAGLHDLDLAHDVRLRARRRPARLVARCAGCRRAGRRPWPRSGRRPRWRWLSTLYAPAYSTLTTACVIFLYMSYVMPTAAGLRALRPHLDDVSGPFDLGRPALPRAGRRSRWRGRWCWSGSACSRPTRRR